MPSGNNPGGYCGRFAPSPTGLLHLGSLLAAVGSFVCARQADGRWLVRIEDIDPPREVDGAADGILRQLEAAQLHWDGPVLRQSTRLPAYRAVADKLLAQRLAFRCSCSRREIAAHRASGATGSRYPGTCRNGPRHPSRDLAVRVRAPDTAVAFRDRWHGVRSVDIASTTGDYVIHRRDDLPAYHLAVVADDAWQGVTEVVRGSDLLDATAHHRHLQRLLNLPEPALAHLPVLAAVGGTKLGKQTGARALLPADMDKAVWFCLQCLMGPLPRELAGAGAGELLAWACRSPPLTVTAGTLLLPAPDSTELLSGTAIE